MPKPAKLSGTTFVRDAIKFDYCIELSITNLLGVCDEVVVVDAGSTDGTRDLLSDWAAREPKLKVFDAEWKPVVGTSGLWLSELANLARSKCQHPYQCSTQADECFHPDDYPAIRRQAMRNRPALCHRLNFWGDPRHLAPHGHVCGHLCVRVGPTSLPFVGDAESLAPENVTDKPGIRIFHLGFLRKPAAFLAKSRALQTEWHGVGGFDKRLQEMEATPAKWVENCPFPLPLIEYLGDYPENVKAWLKTRGYAVE